jgi:lysophospholipid acyltransferase (LPLAT)-like uncharacterized protein
VRAKILAFIGWLIISVWNRTIRLTFVNRHVPDRFASEGTPVIYAFWHGRQFLLLHSHRNSGVVINSSESRDGEIQAGILSRFGFSVVRGSSKRKGERALLGLVDGLRKGKSVAIAVDGPRGPVYQTKPGATYIAGKLHRPIIPVASSAKRRWILAKIWDLYLVPKPFTRGVVLYGEPITVADTSEAELEKKNKELEVALNTLMAEADAYFCKEE